MAEVDKKMLGVERSLGDLGASVANLTDLVNRLEDKVSSAMGPVGPSTAPEIGKDNPVCSSLRMAIIEYVDIVERNNRAEEKECKITGG